jgi:hypothetical protein
MDIVPVDGKQKTGVSSGYHCPPASARSLDELSALRMISWDRSRRSAALPAQLFSWVGPALDSGHSLATGLPRWVMTISSPAPIHVKS